MNQRAMISVRISSRALLSLRTKEHGNGLGQLEELSSSGLLGENKQLPDDTTLKCVIRKLIPTVFPPFDVENSEQRCD